ncbi:MAG TPA: hypothetical protein VF765_05845 [Polyangiaceae bacterium]
MIASNSRRWLALLAVLLPSAAWADPPSSPPSEAQVQAARSLFHEARELHRAGKLDEALDKALAAYHTAPTPVTAMEAGSLLVDLGHLVEARDLLRSVPSLPVSPRESDKGRDARQQAIALAASLDGRIPKVSLAARPPSATILLDGKPLTLDAGTWQGVDPGAHALAVLVDGKPCTTINVTLTESEERTIDLRDATSACAHERAGDAAPAPSPPPLTPVAAPAPSVMVAPAPAAPPSSAGGDNPMRWVGLAIAGAGVVAIGVGGGLALGAKSQYDSVAGQCAPDGCSQAGYDTRNDARSRADVATVVMVVGGVVAAGGVALWLLEPSQRTSVGIGPGTVRLRASW